MSNKSEIKQRVKAVIADPAELSSHTFEDSIFEKAWSKFSRLANNLNSVPDYIEELGGLDTAADSVLGFYNETLRVPDGIATQNRKQYQDLRWQNSPRR